MPGFDAYPARAAGDLLSADRLLTQTADTPQATKTVTLLALLTWMKDQIESGSFDGSIDVLLDGAVLPAPFSTATGVGLMIGRAGGGGNIYVLGEGSGGLHVGRYESSSGSATFRGYHARGSFASPSPIIQNDRTVSIAGSGWEGAAFGQSGEIYLRVIAATPSASDMEGEFVIGLPVAGSATPTTALNFSHRNGLRFGASNVVITAERHFQLRSYTVSTLPSAATAGQLIYVSNGTSNKRLAVSDGTNWRWPDGAVVS